MSMVTLNEIFLEAEPEETILDEIGSKFFDTPLEIKEMAFNEIGNLRTMGPGDAVKDSIKIARNSATREIIRDYKKQFTKDPNKITPILIAKEAGYILDGHHRAMAAYLTKSSIKYIDIGELE